MDIFLIKTKNLNLLRGVELSRRKELFVRVRLADYYKNKQQLNSISLQRYCSLK